MLEDVMARLKAAAPLLGTIRIAESVEAVVDLIGMADDGDAFVVPYRERAQANALATGGHRQAVQVQFIVALVTRHQDDSFGAERAKRFGGLKRSAEQALAGWEPPDHWPCELVGGESTGLGDGISVYAQTWETSTFLTGGSVLT